MTKIVQSDQHGTPCGTYDVYYYHVKANGEVGSDGGSDSSVGEPYVTAITPKVDEVAVAICRSQPGVTKIYGSAKAKASFDASRFA